jgi:hypothetical protein
MCRPLFGITGITTRTFRVVPQRFELHARQSDPISNAHFCLPADGGNATLTQQAQCAAQAKAAYAETQAEWKRSLGDLELVTSDYESHYNTKLQKCLTLLSMTTFARNTRSLGETALLFDPYERRTYASYSSIDRKVAPLPMVCTLTPTHTETTYCKSREEFDS